MVLNEKIAARFHMSLKVIGFDANGIWRWRYEFSKPQDVHIDVVVISETYLKPHERFFIPDHHFYTTDRFPKKNAFPITIYTCSICAIRTFVKCEAYS
jgi:hypothetical protein